MRSFVSFSKDQLKAGIREQSQFFTTRSARHSEFTTKTNSPIFITFIATASNARRLWIGARLVARANRRSQLSTNKNDAYVSNALPGIQPNR